MKIFPSWVYGLSFKLVGSKRSFAENGSVKREWLKVPFSKKSMNCCNARTSATQSICQNMICNQFLEHGSNVLCNFPSFFLHQNFINPYIFDSWLSHCLSITLQCQNTHMVWHASVAWRVQVDKAELNSSFWRTLWITVRSMTSNLYATNYLH